MLRTLLICSLAVALSAALARADEAAHRATVAQLYGAGVHSYFAGEYKEAFDFLSAAADETDDPRVFYYLGLVQKELGRDDEAEASFARGAKLEAGDTEGLYNCSRALQRVQGRARLTIQRYRAKARLERAREIEALRRARYERVERNQPNVVEGARSATPGSPFDENAGKPDIPKVATRPVVRPEVEPATPEPATPEPATPDPAGGKSTTAALGKVIGEWIGGLIPEMPSMEPPGLPLPGAAPPGGAGGATPPPGNSFDF